MKRGILISIALSSVLIVAASLWGGAFAEWMFAMLGALFPVGLIALGVVRQGRIGPVGGPLLGLALLLGCGVLGILILSTVRADEGWVLGLPPATIVMLVLLGAAPLILVGFGYAVTFEDTGPGLRRIEKLTSRGSRD